MKTIFFLFLLTLGVALTGCNKNDAPGVGAATTPAGKAAAPVAPAATVPVNPAGTSAVGVSPSNTISQKEQAEMAAEKTAK